ncbi:MULTISPECIES: hypothetical protein [Streptomyces]|uniref:Heparin-binding hemagglutinin n=2 Tax=Streptomyces TaxID=1883 RepID=A0A100Y0A2_9ACTN|nr:MULTISPECIES: hypothetical protein [Streptomyces]KUH35306.1 hypothetical protein ATE80_30005 [Streptomyces kanasensis]UUS31781.1 hypothetical protein NRO40_13675 [Streptomyces changanensis]
MAIIDELRTPLYFAAGTADLAVQQARRLAAEAPARIDELRKTDPKVVQEKVSTQAKEAQASLQAKVTELVGSLDTDLKKLGETAQGLALRGVGAAAEYAVKAREAYEKVAEHGEQTVRTWRGEAAEEITEIAIAVEPGTTPAQDGTATADAGGTTATDTTATDTAEPTAKPAARRTAATRRAANRKNDTPSEPAGEK